MANRRELVADAVVAGSFAAALSGVPSTVHALARGRDPLEATLAAGSLLLPHEQAVAVLCGNCRVKRS